MEKLIVKIRNLKNKIVVEVNKIKKMSNQKKYEYFLNLFKDKKKENTKKEDVVFEHQIKDTTPEVIELINRFKLDLGLLENDNIESIDLTKKDLYTMLLEYINSKKSTGIFPSTIDIESYLDISKRKRQELLKELFDNGEITKVNPTTYGFREV